MTKGLGCHLIFEFGRFLVGNAGVLLAEVLYVKQNGSDRFVILDTGMTELIRPTLYDAYHEILPLKQARPRAARRIAQIVGPICESGDFITKPRPLPPLAPGAFLAICTAGAYASTMASSYNGRRLAPEAMVHGARYDVVRPRASFDSLIARDRIPAWLARKS
jgi:diaminopimelate decarboxylase